MKPKALAVKAALGTALAAMTLLAPPADAATVKTTTSACTAGTFKGNVSLKYETAGGHHKPVSATMAGGPYIGDSTKLTLRIFFIEDGVTTTAYSRTWTWLGTPPSKVTQPIPDSVTTPDSAKSYVSAAFTGGGEALCTAKAEIK